MSANFLLAIDVGNSRIKAGVMDVSHTNRELPRCIAATAIAASHPRPAEAIRKWVDAQDLHPDRGFLGGVNPNVIASITRSWQAEPYTLTHITRPSSDLLTNRTRQPDRVGPDRLFDAIAADRLRPIGTSALIIDSGTATTVDLVDAEGAFRGGSILAGFELVASALHDRTALLPKVDVAELTPPPNPLGDHTEAALRSGLYWGLVGGVKELVERFSAMASEQDGCPPMVLLTGGAAPLLAPHLPAAQLCPHLTLQGITLCGLKA